MNSKLWLRWMVVGVCIGSLLLPPGMPAAGDLSGRILVRDVALGADGALHGSLMTAEGKPQPYSEVVLLKGAEVVGLAKTQVDGSFTIRQIRPGLYELATSHSTNVYRVWAPRTAPPAAQSTALLVQGNTIVRGQEGVWSPTRRALILGGIIITSGVVGGVIGYTIKDDESAS